jgi:hypothetical protein
MTEAAKRVYYDVDPATGYPAGSDLFYECQRCGDVLPSRPEDNAACTCRNIMIDVDYGRIKIQDHAKVKLFSLRN